MTDSPAPIEGHVAEILTSRELVINRGSSQGVEVDMYFEVIDSKAEDIVDPITDEPLGSIDRPKVVVRVTQVAERLAVAKTFRRQRKNEGGMGVGASALARVFEPPRYVTLWETFRTDPTTREEIRESESFVKVGDPVRQVLDERELPDDTLE